MAITIKISGICDFFAVSDSPKFPDTVNPQPKFIKLNFQLLTMPTFSRPLAHGFPSDIDPSLRDRPTKVRKTSPEQQVANDIIRNVSIASTIIALETQNAEMSIAFETQKRLNDDLRYENEQLAIDKDSIRLLAEESLRAQRLKFEAQIQQDDENFIAYKRKQKLKLRGLRRNLKTAERELANNNQDDSEDFSDSNHPAGAQEEQFNDWPLPCHYFVFDASLYCTEGNRRHPTFGTGNGVGQAHEFCHDSNVFRITCRHCSSDQTIICSTCYEDIHGFPTCDNCNKPYSANLQAMANNPL
jgi:hypothetical protein